MTLPPFPNTRLRRLRRTPALRAMVRESSLSPADFIWPVFVMEGTDASEPVASMPGVSRLTVDRIGAAAKEAWGLGIPAICIFPYTGMDARTEDCALAWSPDNIANQAIKAIKDACPEIAVMTDVAMWPRWGPSVSTVESTDRHSKFGGTDHHNFRWQLHFTFPSGISVSIEEADFFS